LVGVWFDDYGVVHWYDGERSDRFGASLKWSGTPDQCRVDDNALAEVERVRRAAVCWSKRVGWFM
jgi:hypothetical protein